MFGSQLFKKLWISFSLHANCILNRRIFSILLAVHQMLRVGVLIAAIYWRNRGDPGESSFVWDTNALVLRSYWCIQTLHLTFLELGSLWSLKFHFRLLWVCQQFGWSVLTWSSKDLESGRSTLRMRNVHLLNSTSGIQVLLTILRIPYSSIRE